MPDVHLAADVCIGVVVATSRLIYPQAVGGDIGCGMLAVALDLDSTALHAPRVAGQVLAELCHAVPARRRNRRLIIPQPEGVANDRLSHPVLDSVRRREGGIEFATLGSGNHFVEIQADEDARLWQWCSGSRALGQAIEIITHPVRNLLTTGFARLMRNPTRAQTIFTTRPAPDVSRMHRGGQSPKRLAEF
jgi:tRNA-splicing ligase RtcB